VRVQPLSAGLGPNAVAADLARYQIFDFTCALDLITMSTMARS
jgi:hypothetical protein